MFDFEETRTRLRELEVKIPQGETPDLAIAAEMLFTRHDARVHHDCELPYHACGFDLQRPRKKMPGAY